jgi:hypothetical protein
MIAILLLISATFHPAHPSVGDLITVDFEKAPVVLKASPEYELVSQQGKRVVIRTFKPRPFALSGVAGDVAFRNMVVPVRSVLAPNDPLAPAPLKPPRAEPYERMPFIAIAIAALAAAAAWFAVFRMSKRPPVAAATPMATLLPPEERFRRAVALLLSRPQPLRWAGLADALRAYLAATDVISADLTTTEALAVIPSVSEGSGWALRDDAGVSPARPRRSLADARDDVAVILAAGDIEKFSTDEVQRDDFEAIARRALELAA